MIKFVLIFPVFYSVFLPPYLIASHCLCRVVGVRSRDSVDIVDMGPASARPRHLRSICVGPQARQQNAYNALEAQPGYSKRTAL